MLDVHPPHEKIHGFRDFLLHLLTITIGLLIALGLEAFVEHLEHNRLRNEAEHNLRLEIADNRKEVAGNLGRLAKERENFLAARNFLQMEKPQGRVDLDFDVSDLNNASWSTASATGALSFMEYSEVQRFADAYRRQAEFQALQSKALSDFLSTQSLVLFAFSSKRADSTAKDAAERE